MAASFLAPKPRNFVNTSAEKLTRATMIGAVRDGKAGTAMQGFINTLSMSEIEAVVDFVRKEFMQEKKPNTRYHTLENGWPNHERYRLAFPFALGEIPLDTPDGKLTSQQQQGKQLFMSSCITCHDRAKVEDEGEVWEPFAVSYPRNQYLHSSKDSTDSDSGATPYAKHDIAPTVSQATAQVKRGQRLFQQNCAFCHAADGTGKNWIGSFLQPHPRNLADSSFMKTMTKARLKQVIRDGLPGTTMPAWKNILTEEQIDSLIAYIDRAFHPILQ